MVVVDYHRKTRIIIPADVNIASEEKEKVIKYQQLRIQLENL